MIEGKLPWKFILNKESSLKSPGPALVAAFTLNLYSIPRFKFSTSKDVSEALASIFFAVDESFASLYSKIYPTISPLASLGGFHVTRTDVLWRNWTLGWRGGPGPIDRHTERMYGHRKYYKTTLDSAPWFSNKTTSVRHAKPSKNPRFHMLNTLAQIDRNFENFVCLTLRHWSACNNHASTSRHTNDIPKKTGLGNNCDIATHND